MSQNDNIQQPLHRWRWDLGLVHLDIGAEAGQTKVVAEGNTASAAQEGPGLAGVVGQAWLVAVL